MRDTQKRLAEVVYNAPLGPGLCRIELSAPNLGRAVAAGRFAMVEAVGRSDCILLRPYSYFCADGADRIGFLIKDVGPGTRSLLHARVGEQVQVLGPLGSTFPRLAGQVWAVAGGVGAAPFGLLPTTPPAHILFGARTVGEAGFADALRERGAQVQVATDDGSSGYQGSVVDLLAARLKQAEPPAAVFTCGPTAMMQAVVQVARAHGVAAYASLEERMGCGIGICRGCAHPDAQGRWRCICVDGPVYNAAEIFT